MVWRHTDLDHPEAGLGFVTLRSQGNAYAMLPVPFAFTKVDPFL